MDNMHTHYTLCTLYSYVCVYFTSAGPRSLPHDSIDKTKQIHNITRACIMTFPDYCSLEGSDWKHQLVLNAF